ncbi:hypothetical protein [Desulfatitalea alkaliphila]|uniref:FTP domain-containing protein n=1 Tax=Desulfatitalea alkaliphila TaxID=2929485 RepID=A0AA41R266_9BACT|nr:hypothetical protein [Desulfatitalea alkaliphila]MCJ8501244.1 hypothetical protein [Desulfatitalea alkaliphila]
MKYFRFCMLIFVVTFMVSFTACRTTEPVAPKGAETPIQQGQSPKPGGSDAMTAPPHTEMDLGANGIPVRIKGNNLASNVMHLPAYEEAHQRNDYGEIVFLVLERHNGFFKLSRPREELRITSVQKDTLGSAHVKMEQVVETVPVEGKIVTAHFNKEGAFYLFQGDFIPSDLLATLSTSPRLTAAEASARALDAAPTPGSTVQETSLVVFPTSPMEARLAYHVVVAKGLMSRHGIYVDAMDGGILHTTSLVQH